MKKMFATKSMWRFVLFFALPILFVSKNGYGHSETGKFDFQLRVNAESLFNQIEKESAFTPEVTACFGSHLISKYSFSKFGFSAGIGADRLKFSQRILFANNAEGREYSTVDFSYLALDIPILAHYSLTDRIEIFGGVNIVAAIWLSYGMSGVSNRTSELKTSADEDIPSWQFTQEVMAGLNHKLTDRFDIGFSVAKSLSNIEGMSVKLDLSVPDQDDVTISEKFDFSWTRLNFELAYRLNK